MMVPWFDALFRGLGASGVDSLVLTMPHRGRLNLMVSVLGYAYRLSVSFFVCVVCYHASAPVHSLSLSRARPFASALSPF
jgi:hypothetical protein